MEKDKEKDTEYDLHSLGIVLGVQNDMIKRSLNMLQAQQRRQVFVIWAALAIAAIAVVMMGFSNYIYSGTLDKISEQVNRNTQLSVHNAEVIEHAYTSEEGQGLP